MVRSSSPDPIRRPSSATGATTRPRVFAFDPASCRACSECPQPSSAISGCRCASCAPRSVRVRSMLSPHVCSTASRHLKPRHGRWHSWTGSPRDFRRAPKCRRSPTRSAGQREPCSASAAPCSASARPRCDACCGSGARCGCCARVRPSAPPPRSAGYADQSHLHREVRALAGAPVAELRQLPSAANRSMVAPSGSVRQA